MTLRALDLFCGAGGATRGLQLAGFHVTGVDMKRSPRYVGDSFVQADVFASGLDFRAFDFIWASPPCQANTSLRHMWNAKDTHVDRVDETRELLIAIGVPYVIENVVGAKKLRATIQLCGTMFDLRTPCGAELQRHRLFETSFMLLQPECRHGASVIGVYGGHVRDRCRTVSIAGEYIRDNSTDKRRVISVVGDHMKGDYERRRVVSITGQTPQQNVVRNRERKTYTVEDARVAMGMPWATIAELSQAIPPAYSEYIARAWLAQRIVCEAAE